MSYAYQYAIFPMECISISKRYHANHKSWDINGSTTDRATKDYWYAPCDIKVLALYKSSESIFYNTVLFGTCDSSGNKCPVRCEDDVDRVLTFACTHMDTEDWDEFGYYVGKVFQSGEKAYREGFEGLDPNEPLHGNHVHMDVGLDWQYEKVFLDNQYRLRDTEDNGKVLIANTFRQLDNFNYLGNSGANEYTFKTTNGRDFAFEIPPTGDEEKVYMKLTGSAARLRSDVVNGSIKTTVPVGQQIEVIGLYSWNASDGYKWGYGRWNGYEGYFQFDPYVMNPVGHPSFETYKMHLFGSAARIRSSIMGTILTTVDNYNDIYIDQFIDGKQSDGYQWCRGHFNGVYGYFQFDPAVMFPTND